MATTPRTAPWWQEDGGFFGDLYLEADDSLHTFFEGGSTLGDRTEQEAAGVIRLCGLDRGARVLDCPCGYGRHSLALARHGMRVTGVDINRRFLGLAETAAREQRAPVRYLRADMRDLPALEPMDAVVNLFYSFGFFTAEEDRAVLRGFHRCLRPGGRFLMHTMVTVPALRDGRVPPEEQRELAGGSVLRIQRRLVPEPAREQGRWTIVDRDGVERTSAPYEMRVYQAEEFAALCREAGFRDVRLYGQWREDRPYHDGSPYLIAVAVA